MAAFLVAIPCGLIHENVSDELLKIVRRTMLPFVLLEYIEVLDIRGSMHMNHDNALKAERLSYTNKCRLWL